MIVVSVTGSNQTYTVFYSFWFYDERSKHNCTNPKGIYIQKLQRISKLSVMHTFILSDDVNVITLVVVEMAQFSIKYSQ